MISQRGTLSGKGSISAKIARTIATSEFEKFRIIQDKLFESDFDIEIKHLIKSTK